jgi:hypothetical protein
MPDLLAVLTDLDPIEPIESDDAHAPPRLPSLERHLARAARVDAPSDWRRFVLQRLGLDAPSGDLAVGATLAAAAGLDPSAGTWMVATPVPLRATLTDVRMDAAGPSALDAASAARAAATLTSACGDPAFTLHAAGTTLLACFHDALEVETSDPAPLAGRRIDVQLPRGRDGGRVRRRMTELQMVLHESPLAGANALWLWGGGRVPPAGRASWPAVEGDDPFVRALHARDGGRVDRPDARLVTWRLADFAADGDAFGVADRAWSSAVAAALAGGRVRRATLHVAGRAFELRPAQRWRFWAKVRPWWELAA